MLGWVERARQDGRSRHAVRAVGKLRLRGPSGSGSLKQVLVAERPAQLRLEGLDFLGQIANLLVTDGDEFAFFDGRAIERGGVSADVLRLHMGLDVEPDEAVELIVVSPALPVQAPNTVLGRGDERVLEYPGERLHFSAEGELAGVDALHADGRVRFSARYERWRNVPGGRYPYAMRFHFPASELSAELELEEVEINPVLDRALFSLPEGAL